jgi:hypothetical protein
MQQSKWAAALVGVTIVVTGVAGNAGQTSALSPAQIRQDIALYRSSLEERHPSLLRYSTPQEVESFFTRLDRDADRITSERELYARLAPFAEILKDGHTALQRSEAAQRAAADTKLLPFELYLLDNRLWVLRSRAAAVPSAAEIVSIGDEPAASVVRRVRSAEPRDGNSEGGPRFTLSRRFRFARQLAALDGEREAYRLGVRIDGAADVVNVEVSSETWRSLQESAPPPQGAGDVLSLTTVQDVPVLTLRAFGAGLEARLRETVRTVVQQKSTALVIDVRGNGGGMDALGLQLFAHLASGPFQYYRSLRVRVDSTERPFTGHPNLGTHQPDSVNYRGRVVVLMDGGSFSTTAEFLAAARASGRATFVGEESGGAECGNTSGRSTMVTLPNSGLLLHIPLVRYDTAIPCDGRGRGILPDVAVPITVQDLLAGRDPQMARAIQIAREKGL